MRPILTTVLMACCWPVWMFAGVLLRWIGLDDVDIVGRVCLEFAFLTGAEFAFTRLVSQEER
jgi:hypothetical protein